MGNRKKDSDDQPTLFGEPTMAGALANCDRCGVRVQVAAARSRESWPFRLATVPQGLCANCAVTTFLYNTYPINMQLDESGPQLLLHPSMRQAFAHMIRNCDMNDSEINWEIVVENWHLPVVEHLGPTNPYRMGDAARLAAREREMAQADEGFERDLALLLGGNDEDKQASIRDQLRDQRPRRFVM